MIPDAEHFVHEWVAAWNGHNLEQILSHYADDFEMSSPYIAQIAGEPSGTLKGKAAVGAYWRKALERMPHFQFTPILTLRGADSIALYYEAAMGRTAVEVFFFRVDGKVQKAAAHYA